MLELLVLRVLHDGPRLFVFLDGDALLIPVDRFTFFRERCDHSREGAGFGWQFVRWLMVVFKSHSVSNVTAQLQNPQSTIQNRPSMLYSPACALTHIPSPNCSLPPGIGT